VRPRGVSPPAGAVTVPQVLALVADLLFGSRLQGQLQAAGIGVELIGDPTRLGERLRDAAAPRVGVLILDLTDSELAAAAAAESLRAADLLEGVRTLAFYSHVEPEVRARAQAAGIELVVPRSRMAREGALLVRSL